MKISVIIPVYKVAAFIADCLQSVLTQSYKDVEIVLVDDCSPDNSMEVAERALAAYKGGMDVLRIRHDVNKGLSEARNSGIRAATGDYLYFLDSDDELAEGALAALAAAAADGLSDMVVGDYKVVGSDEFFPPLKLPAGRLMGRDTIIKAYMREKVYVMAWNKMVKRTFLLEHDLFFAPGIIHEDCLWSFQCACLSTCWDVVRIPTYIYKVRPGSIKTASAVHHDIECLRMVLSAMVDSVKRYGLTGNKYVYCFLEEEKLRLLYTYLSAELPEREITDDLYPFCRSLDYVHQWQPAWWSHLKTRYMVRDAHYYLSPQLQGQYYVCVPRLLGVRSRRGGRRLLILWVLGTWLRYLCGMPRCSMPGVLGRGR